MSLQEIVELKDSKNNIIISLPKDDANKLMVDLNIALDRIRCFDTNTVKSTNLTEKERDIIQRALILKKLGHAYKHV